jgi:hypothetical protein
VQKLEKIKKKNNKNNMIYILKKDFQHTASDGVILFLKVGTKIDRKDGDEYIITQARKEFRIKAVIVENNPTFFEKIDLKAQLTTLCKINVKRTAPKMAEILVDFIDKEILADKELVDNEQMKVVLEACRLQYISTKEDKWLIPIQKLGWSVDSKGVFKN